MEKYTYSNIKEFSWSKINDDVERFISVLIEDFRLSYLYVETDSGDGVSFIRDEFTLNKLSNLNSDFKMKSCVIGLYKNTWL